MYTIILIMSTTTPSLPHELLDLRLFYLMEKYKTLSSISAVLGHTRAYCS